MAWHLVSELRQLSNDLVSVSPQSDAIKSKHPAILDSAARQIERACEDRFYIRKIHREILSKVDEAQKKAIGDYEESLHDGYQSQYCNGVLRGMRIVRELLAVLEHNRGLPTVESWQDREPNEAALLRKAIEALREVKEDLGADGEVSQHTESMVHAVLLAAC